MSEDEGAVQAEKELDIVKGWTVRDAVCTGREESGAWTLDSAVDDSAKESVIDRAQSVDVI